MNKDEIIKLAAHEIKTPISVIHGYAELMKYDIIKADEQKETTEKIQKETLRMARLVDELEVYFLLSENKYKAEKEKIDLKVLLLDEVITEFSGEINTDISVSGEGIVYGDAELIKLMIKHIVENAIKYNNSGEKKVTCIIDNHNGRIALSIKDNGMGIMKEERNAVFECFYRVNKLWSRDNGSNGMGLAICKKIADIHGAEILIDSIFNEGTKVTVEF